MSKELSLKMRTMIGGYWLSQCIYVAAKAGIADLVSEGVQSVELLAERAQLKPELLHRVLRALASEGIFQEESPKVFTHTPLSQLLESGREDSLRNVSLYMGDEPYESFTKLYENLESGTPGFELLHGEPYFDSLKKKPKQSEIFNKAMAEISYHQVSAVLDAIDLSGVGTVVDIGGGNGFLLAQLLHRYPNLKGVLFEQENVLSEAREYFAGEQLLDRVQLVSGDFFEDIPKDVDVYLMKYIIHDWEDTKAELILRNCKEAGGSDARILVVEQMIPSGNDPLYTKLSDILMEVLLGSRERSEEEFRALFSRAGLEINSLTPTDYLLWVFELSES